MIVSLAAWGVDPAGALPGPDLTGAIRGLVATAVVLALIVVLAWLLKRGTLVWPGRRPGAPVAVETAIPLGERRSLVIVAVEGRRLLLGLTPSTVSLVTELSTTAAGPFSTELNRQANGESR
jgi:flagellar biosynthetic protein FliO